MTSWAPSAATMAPLSVQSERFGTSSRIPAAAVRSASRPQPRVRRHAAAQQQRTDALLAAGQHGLAGDHVQDSLLEARRDVGHRRLCAFCFEPFDAPRHRSLQSGKGGIVAMRTRGLGRPHVFRRRQTAREPDGLPVAGFPARRSPALRGNRDPAAVPPCQRPPRRRRRSWRLAVPRPRRCCRP